MDKHTKYRNASIANFTPAELQKARDNAAISARRHPEEHARTMAIIEEKGLGNHREIINHFIRYCAPMTDFELGTISCFVDTSYAGAFSRGEQYEAPAIANSSAADLIYRPAIKPDGA